MSDIIFYGIITGSTTLLCIIGCLIGCGCLYNRCDKKNSSTIEPIYIINSETPRFQTEKIYISTDATYNNMAGYVSK